MQERDLRKPDQDFETQRTELTEVVPPTIVFDKSLESAPYSVDVNREKCGELFRMLGMTESDVGKTKITITSVPKGFSWLGFLVKKQGESDALNDSITIYTDGAWKRYQEYLKLAKKIAKKERKPWQSQFEEVLYTKKLSSYLTVAPPQRGVEFANKLILNGVKRWLNSTLIHESKHALDWGNGIVLGSKTALMLGSFVGLTAGLVYTVHKTGVNPIDSLPLDVTMGFLFSRLFVFPIIRQSALYYIDPMERRANKLKKLLENNPKWRAIMTITPKESIAMQNSVNSGSLSHQPKLLTVKMVLPIG